MEGITFVEIISDISLKVYTMLTTTMPMILKFFITKFKDMEGVDFIVEEMGLGDYMPLDLMLGAGLVITLVSGILGFFRKLFIV